MRRWVLFLLRWLAPPGAFLAWAYGVYSRSFPRAIQAFGPVDAALAAESRALYADLAAGFLLLSVWAAAWGVGGAPGRRVRKGRARPQGRADPSEPGPGRRPSSP